jgi:hypothetical protein
MNKRTIEKLNKINSILEQYNQITRVVELSPRKLVLNNGTVVSDSNEIQRFVKRVCNTKHDLWVKNIDNLIIGKILPIDIRRQLGVVGGKNCQLTHGEKIKKNLNHNGKDSHWNRGKKLDNYITKSGNKYKPWNKGKTKEDNESLANLSKQRTGQGNPMYGKLHTEENKKKQSELIKNRILTGEFTPNSNNRNTHWDSFYKNKKYRSSWEAFYQYLNPCAEYEKLRIPYNYDNESKVYIVDFVDHKNKKVAEVKPKELTNDTKFIIKFQALQEWASKNDYICELVTQFWLIDNRPSFIDYKDFDVRTQEKIKKLYEANQKN